MASSPARNVFGILFVSNATFRASLPAIGAIPTIRFAGEITLSGELSADQPNTASEEETACVWFANGTWEWEGEDGEVEVREYDSPFALCLDVETVSTMAEVRFSLEDIGKIMDDDSLPYEVKLQIRNGWDV